MFVKLNGVDFYVERYGAGPTLLLLHGFSGSSADWSRFIPEFSRYRTVVTIDLIGHGRSSSPSDIQRYAMDTAVHDLWALLDQIGYDQIDILGYSMGGRVALQMACAEPERIRSLILESASPGLAEPAERAARVASDTALAERIEQEDIEWFADYWGNLPLFATQSNMPVELRAAIRSNRLENSPHGLAGSLLGMGTGAQRSLWDTISALNAPVLLLNGALDVKFTAVNRAMAKLLPAAEHRIIAGAGHNIHLEAPQAFSEAVVGFLHAHIYERHTHGD